MPQAESLLEKRMEPAPESRVRSAAQPLRYWRNTVNAVRESRVRPAKKGGTAG